MGNHDHRCSMKMRRKKAQAKKKARAARVVAAKKAETKPAAGKKS